MIRVDLHGLSPEKAIRRLAQELHACRVRGDGRVLVITRRGWGNRRQEPILRRRVESWLEGPEGRRAGVIRFRGAARGGALEVELSR